MAGKKWTDEQRAAHSERMKLAHANKRRAKAQVKVWEEMPERKTAQSKVLRGAWDLARCKCLLHVGKLRILWG